MKRSHGFTLIELLTVIVIIGIVIGIGIPAMTTLTRSQGLQGGVRQVSNIATLARQYAITHRTQAEVKINTTSYTAITVFANGAQIDKWTVLPLGVVIDPASAGSIVFKPTGNLTSPTDLKIIVREGNYRTNAPAGLVAVNTNKSTITVSALLGRVSITSP